MGIIGDLVAILKGGLNQHDRRCDGAEGRGNGGERGAARLDDLAQPIAHKRSFQSACQRLKGSRICIQARFRLHRRLQD